MKRASTQRSVGVSTSCIVSALILIACGNGCAGAKAYRQGKEAEKRGEAHIAYAYYAQAAQSNPDDRDYTRSLKRLGPTAANFWINSARLAEAEGRVIDAWKSCMRCLMIQPDHPEGLAYINELDAKHGTKLSAVKRDWQNKGAAILAIKVPPKPPAQVSARPPVPQISNSGPTAKRDIAQANKPAAVRKTPAQKAKRSQRKWPPKSESPPKTPKQQISTNREQPTKPNGARPNSYVLSRDNDRYGDRVKAIDDLIVELQDTSDELEADIDLYDGKRRIQKIRGLKVGRSKLLLTPQNRWFRLSLERVDHESETIAFRLDPA